MGIIHSNPATEPPITSYPAPNTHWTKGTFPSAGMIWPILMVSVLTLSPVSSMTSTSTPPSTSTCNMTACSSIDQGWTCSNTANINCQTSSTYCNEARGWNGQCVRDDGATRVLSDQNIHSHSKDTHGYPSSNNCVSTCITMCRSKGFTYAGVEYGYQCFCGNTPPPTSNILTQSQCWYKCYGDHDQYCGGFHTMNVYATGECHCCPPETPDPEPLSCNNKSCSNLGQGWTCGNTSDLGNNNGCKTSKDFCNKAQGWDGQCVEDLGKQHLNFKQAHKHTQGLDGFLTTANSVTKCIQSCLEEGYSFAAMEDGYQCFCGNDPPPTGLILPQSRCNYRCPGDESQFCGGFRTMNVYATTDECTCCPPLKTQGVSLLTMGVLSVSISRMATGHSYTQSMIPALLGRRGCVKGGRRIAVGASRIQ